MYRFTLNKERGLMVGWNDGTPDTDADFVRTVDSSVALDREPAAGDRTRVTVLVVDPGATRPNALQRKRIADAIELYRARHAFALVTASTVMRGVLTALEWFNKHPERYRTSAHATFDAAARWAEAQRGEPLGELHAMWKELRTTGGAQRIAG